MVVDAVSSKAQDFTPTIECYIPEPCESSEQEVQEIKIPVCMNQCKAAGDSGSTCNEDADNESGYTCSCSNGYQAGEITCEDVDECLDGSNSCSYENCMNNEGSYTCAGESAQNYSGLYQIASGSFKQMTLSSFILLPRPSGSGSDENGDFEIVDAVAVSAGDHSQKTIEFFKKYSNGARERVNFKVTVGTSGIVGSHTTFSSDGTSYSGSLTLDLAQDAAAVEDAELTKSAEYRIVYIADPDNGSTIFGGRDVLNSVVNDSLYYPRVSASGSNEYGTFIDEGVADTIRDGDSISYTMHKKFADFTVEMKCKMDGIENGAASGFCDYDVINGADAKGWSGTAKKGTLKFGLARETGDGSSKGLIASKEPAAVQFEWTGSDDEINRITFECSEFTRFPKYFGNCDSNYGAASISATDDTPVLPNIESNVKLNFQEAGFECDLAVTRTSLGESFAGNFGITCTDAPFSDGYGTYGGMAKVGASIDDVSTDKFVTSPTNMYYKTTVTTADGTKKVINKSQLGVTLFPRNEGQGNDDYLGSFKSVQLTDSSASGPTTKKQLYENGEWAEFTYTTKADGNNFVFTGDYIDSKGLVGTYESIATRDEDPIAAQYENMQVDMPVTVNDFDENGAVIDTCSGSLNLNMGEGLPTGKGVCEKYGEFDWIGEEPEINYQDGTMTMRSTRSYKSGWFADYTSVIPYPVAEGVNAFISSVETRGNTPAGVKKSFKVMKISEQKGENAVQSFLSETGPTEAEALFTNDNGDEYKLKFENYQRFAGFHPDGTAKVAGTSSAPGLGNVNLITGDYSTVADGYYTETMTVGGQECTITYRPNGGPAMDESGDYESNCPNLRNGSWKSAKGPGASLDKYVEEETRVDDVSTRTCGELTGDNAKCKDRTITGTMTTVYFPRVEGHGTDDYHGKFKRYALADTSFTGENTKVIEYDDGFTTRNVYTLKIVNGKVEESGYWYDSDGTWGTYGYGADVKEVVNTEASCPAIGQDRDEPWVESWEVKRGCPKPICPKPMLDITDKWTRSAGRTKKNGVSVKKFKYGMATTIHIPEGFSEWSVGLRFPKNQERGSFQVFNAKFENIYETENETIVLLSKKWWTGGDLLDGDSFTFVADHLMDQSNPSLLFFPIRFSGRNMNSCFRSNRQQRSGGSSGFEAAVKASRQVKSADDVTRVRMIRGKVVSVASN